MPRADAVAFGAADAGPQRFISSPLPAVTLTDDQRKHLDFIQAVIARLASTSTASKGFALTVASATFGFAATKAVPGVAGIGLLVVASLAVLDAYYLREERLFRRLYDQARHGLVDVYSMNKDAYASKSDRKQVICSWSVAGFYGPLLLVGLGTLIYSAVRVTAA